MNNIYLVGMMGSGKSVTGKVLAERLSRRFIETDQFIVEATGETIPDIFKLRGEAEFRDLESEVLLEASSWDAAVISTGGGIVTRASNILRMKETGCIVYLRATPETIWCRIYNDPNRPLLDVDDPFRRIQDLLKERKDFYQEADITVDTDGKTAETVAEEILPFIKA